MAVLGLFASGAGNSAPGFAAPLGSQFLSALRLGSAGDAPAAGATPAVDPAAVPDAVPLAVEPVSSTAPVAAPEAPPTSAPPVDRPIVAPANFPRARAAAARSTRTAYAAGPKDGGVWAVVVGIDDYPGTDADLNAAVA
ncbi:MAG: hypothetical protein QOF96_4135, partial [Actinomycetota bacterium]|nr:hypothetical protein [Actinomycetota bacterium]